MSSRPIYARRLVWIAVLCTTISVFIMFVILANGVLRQTSHIVAELTAAGMRSKAGLGCRSAPSHWGMTTTNGSQIYAYDIQTMSSMNKEAPTLLPQMVAEIKKGAKSTRTRMPILRGGGTLLLKVSEKGPCSLLRIHWRVGPQVRLLNLFQLVSIFLLGIGLCLTFAYHGFVKPMLKRIESLASIAQNVGQKDSLFKTTHLQKDDLGIIEEGLELANQKIREDKQVLAAKNLALSQHIADMAHDLRTPISSLQLVLERMTQTQHGEPHKDLSIAIADTVYLEQLTNNLSMATRLREGLVEEDTRPLDLRDVVERVAGRLGLLAREKGLSLDFACPDQEVWVKGSDTLYERALSNLVHNAIRYGEQEGHVVLLLETSASSFSLQVMDDGPGVPPSEIPRLQDRLYRSSEARQRDSTGQGLGLAITHEICEKLGLSLDFEAIEPRGLRATLKGST